jgi:class 3 adenylate cyclase
MTDAERDRSLRRLRFDNEMEPRFQFDYYRQILPSLRVGLSLTVLLMIGQGIIGYFQSAALSQALIVTSVRIFPLLAGLGLTYWPGFWRYWQLYFGALIVIGVPIGTTLRMANFIHSPFLHNPAAQLGYLGALTLFGMIVLAGMLRLHFRWTMLIEIGMVGSSLHAAILHIHLPPEVILMTYGSVVFPPLVMIVFSSFAYERLHRTAFLNHHLLEIERARSESLLRNALPDAIVDRLKASEELIADDHVEVTVLFGDIVDFTPWSADRSAREVLQFLNEVFCRFDRLVEEFGLEKIKTVGDCYMVVAGAPEPRADHVEAAARLALAMQAEAARLSREQGTEVRFRIGIHTGPLVAGVIGEKRFLYDVWGDTVNTASRLESYGSPGEIQVSAEVAERLQGRFRLKRRGEIEIKGKGRVETYFLVGEKPHEYPPNLIADPASSGGKR